MTDLPSRGSWKRARDSASARLYSVKELLWYFARGQRWFFVPLVLVLLIASLLLVLTSGLSYVAPFVYGLF